MNTDNTRDTERIAFHRAFEVYDKIDTASLTLSTIPHVIELLISNYKLDNASLDDGECFDLVMGRDKIYQVLWLTQRTIWDFEEKLKEIGFEEFKKGSEATTETTK